MKSPDLERLPSRQARTVGNRVRHVASWLVRRRRIMAHQFLRGLSYGAGTSLVAFLAWWLRARYGG